MTKEDTSPHEASEAPGGRPQQEMNIHLAYEVFLSWRIEKQRESTQKFFARCQRKVEIEKEKEAKWKALFASCIVDARPPHNDHSSVRRRRVEREKRRAQREKNKEEKDYIPSLFRCIESNPLYRNEVTHGL